MASTTNVILAAVAALILWTVIGLAVARAVLPARTLIWPVAPVLGWAVHSAATGHEAVDPGVHPVAAGVG